MPLVFNFNFSLLALYCIIIFHFSLNNNKPNDYPPLGQPTRGKQSAYVQNYPNHERQEFFKRQNLKLLTSETEISTAKI